LGLFAECIDKLHFDPNRGGRSIDEQAFEQVVSRFEQYLVNAYESKGQKNYGLLVHDNNETVARKLNAAFSSKRHVVDKGGWYY
jgi:hypothetical protein